MTVAVTSYVAGRWQDPAGDRVSLLDATTARTVAEIGTAPIDLAPVIDHARSVGGPALRALTFHERALVLKRLALHLNGRRDEFYALSTLTGATRTVVYTPPRTFHSPVTRMKRGSVTATKSLKMRLVMAS